MLFMLLIFFFQAEDGIRDGTVTGVQTCALPISHRQIAVNIVVAHQCHPDGSPIRDKKGKDISRTDYVTSLAPGRYGVKVRGFYRGRWGIENQGFRWLSQTWDIDRPTGHSLGSVQARLVLVLKNYN